MSDNGAGMAVTTAAVMGVTYLLVEAIVSFLVLGLAFGAVAVVVLFATIIGYIIRHPIHRASGWLAFTIGGGLAVVAPFFVMYLAVMHGHTSVQSDHMSGAADFGSLFCFAWLCATVFWAVPGLYDKIEKAGR